MCKTSWVFESGYENMMPNKSRISTREQLILAGLYLSKYDSIGLKKLGFATFAEAFNVVGYALGARPASIKNYRDEFDPLFPNRRKGWHKRSVRDYCMKVFETYKDWDLESFTNLIEAFFGYDKSIWSPAQEDEGDESESLFAKRLITGLAAEKYFEVVQPTIPEFRNYAVENTTRLGCGYDFRLRMAEQEKFLAVEVKGLAGRTGSLSLTPREHGIAAEFSDHFFLFVVKNFQESPFHEIFPDPLSGNLRFTKVERVRIDVSWLTSV
jgi:hypothetical protein